MSKYLLRAYLDNNIGDDLMVEIFTSNAKDSTFYIKSNAFELLGYENRFSNVKKIPNNIVSQILLLFKYDAFITIGGSMFQEPNNKNKRYIKHIIRSSYNFSKVLLTNILFKLSKKKVFIIGCNVGPIYSKWFHMLFKMIFKTSDYTTVRDRQSYELLYSMRVKPSNVFLAPDMVHQFLSIPFQLQRDNGIKIGISVIDLKHDDLNKNYISFLLSMITAMKNSNSDISFYIYSFNTGFEDDRVISESLAAQIDSSFNVKSIVYTGDIQNFLSIFKLMDYVICSRFHSIILAMNFNIPILPISYSEKTNNYLHTIKYMGVIIDSKSIDEQIIMKYCVPNVCFSFFTTYSSIESLRNDSKIHLQCFNHSFSIQQVNTEIKKGMF